MGRTNTNGRKLVKFYFDRIVDGKPYPNLARHQARPYTPEWREFSKNWPFSEPVHFLEYLDQEHIEYQLVTTPENAIYPISISFFDFGVEWFNLIDSATLSAFRAKTCKLWFFYSEGDNPQRIQQHLLAQCIQHNIPKSQIHFTSANSSASKLDNFSYFADDEMLYRLRNKHSAVCYHERPRSKKFTALVRTHKWWRATTMARIWSENLHSQGYFSYNTQISVDESVAENPIEVDVYNMRSTVNKFIESCPYYADDYDYQWHNLYSNTVPEHHSDSYLNLILETHLDADQSGGTFLTEKTFKPIKHCQLFLVVGPAGSVAQLRKMGYKTFDTWIDHSYDSIQDNSQRWDAVMKEFKRLCRSNLHKIYTDCSASLQHNRRLFLASKAERLNTLLQKVNK